MGYLAAYLFTLTLQPAPPRAIPFHQQEWSWFGYWADQWKAKRDPSL